MGRYLSIDVWFDVLLNFSGCCMFSSGLAVCVKTAALLAYSGRQPFSSWNVRSMRTAVSSPGVPRGSSQQMFVSLRRLCQVPPFDFVHCSVICSFSVR